MAHNSYTRIKKLWFVKVSKVCCHDKSEVQFSRDLRNNTMETRCTFT